jgi:hypothetical protein
MHRAREERDNPDAPFTALSGARLFSYLCVIVNTPSQFFTGSSVKYSWHRFK